MYIVSHRGGSLECDENSIKSIKYSMELPVDAIEMDIYFTKDNVPVVNHDPSLNRIYRIDECIININFSKIFGIIPSLDEILKIVNGNKKLFIEIKGIPSEKNLTKLSSLLSSYSGSYTILSFNYNTLKFLSHFFSSYILTFVTSNVFSNEIIELITHEKLFDNIALCHTSVDTKNMEQYVNKKIKIFLYTVNYESDYLILKNKCGNMISGLITDRPLHFINLLKFSL
jgi:glycerophosphoryl diester phosphodiesterase